MTQQVEKTDSQIADQVLAGNQTQYQILVERHHRAVFNAAYRLLGNQAEASDITQDTFLRAYKALDTFRPGASMSPWLRQIAINLSLNALKKRKHALSLDTEQRGTALEIPDFSAEPQRRLLQNEQQDELRQAILTLPPEQRAVIELRHFQELSYQEIAKILDISLSNVKVRLFRARKKLKEILEK